ncbi:MAG: DUF4340 domain-containing protein [Wenzhouxiangellaceae bacterium]|nr:DUF4340 domain-containing protein [Wenzhouxiangellaceae bacterium]
MKRKQLIILALLTLAAVVLVLVLDPSGQGAPDNPDAGLLPGLQDQVNDIDAIDVIAPGGQRSVTLRRDQARWRVGEKDDYEADFAQVAELLRVLREARIDEAKTANPQWYSRLGVQDMTAPDASGRRLDFPGSPVSSVIIGQAGPTGSGSYARRADEQRSWLLDRLIEVPIDPVAWLERSIMDIGFEDLAEVVIRHPDGETVRLRRAGDEDPEFVLLEVPEDARAGPARLRKAIANGLRGLNLEDVRRHQPPLPDDAVRVLFVTIDGLNFVADVWQDDESAHWIHFTVSAENSATDVEADPLPSEASDPAGSDDPSAMAEAEVGLDEASAGDDMDDDAATERLVSAVAVDARLSPWEFRISERRFEDLTRRMDALLEAPGESTE